MSDSTSETASRPVPSQGFGDLAKYPLPTCPQDEKGDDGDDDSQAAMEYGVVEGKEVGHDGSALDYGFKK